MIINLDTS